MCIKNKKKPKTKRKKIFNRNKITHPDSNANQPSFTYFLIKLKSERETGGGEKKEKKSITTITEKTGKPTTRMKKKKKFLSGRRQPSRNAKTYYV